MMVGFLGVPVGMFAMFVSLGGMLLGGFVIAVLVMMGCLVVVMSGRMMMSGGLQMVLRRVMLLGHGLPFLAVERVVRLELEYGCSHLRRDDLNQSPQPGRNSLPRLLAVLASEAEYPTSVCP